MTLSYYSTKEEWKQFVDVLRTYKGITISNFPKTNSEGIFTDFEYVTFEYNNEYYYVQKDFFKGFSITRYAKISPYEKQQNAYPREIYSTDALFDYINEPGRRHILDDTYKQRIISDFYKICPNGKTIKENLYANAGFREREVINNLHRIEMLRHDDDYCVVRFHANNGNTFDFEINSQRIVG